MKKLKRLFANEIVIRSLRSKKMFGFAAVGAGLAAFGAQVHAQTTIISDDFSSASSNYGNNLIGTSPSPDGVNLPGGKYLNVSYQPGFSSKYDFAFIGNPPNYYGSISNYEAGFGAVGTSIDNGQAVALDLGSYDAGVLAVTGTVGYHPGYNNGGALPAYGTAYTLLGFNSSTSSYSAYSLGSAVHNGIGKPNYTGLIAFGDGSLQDYVNGVANGSAIAFGGTYDPTTGTTLSYDLDTTTGAISNVTFGASTATYSFALPGSFSAYYTVSTSIGGSGGVRNGSVGEITDFSVSTVAAVPEPSTYALLAGGALALGAYQYRRRHQTGI